MEMVGTLLLPGGPCAAGKEGHGGLKAPILLVCLEQNSRTREDRGKTRAQRGKEEDPGETTVQHKPFNVKGDTAPEVTAGNKRVSGYWEPAPKAG